MHARRCVSLQEGAHGIDLAPMLDFVVNLLIFFVITAVFVKEAGIEVGRPRAHAAASTDAPLRIDVDSDGSISIGGRVVDTRALRANAERMLAEHSYGGAVIVAAPRAPTGALVRVVDEIRLAGIENVTFSTVSQ